MYTACVWAANALKILYIGKRYFLEHRIKHIKPPKLWHSRLFRDSNICYGNHINFPVEVWGFAIKIGSIRKYLMLTHCFLFISICFNDIPPVLSGCFDHRLLQVKKKDIRSLKETCKSFYWDHSIRQLREEAEPVRPFPYSTCFPSITLKVSTLGSENTLPDS